jgi:LuxR family maltose regulon positive regulatory protein
VSEEGLAERTGGIVAVERRALVARLAAHRDVPIVVVHAGAGYGKTTLAEQWAAGDTRPHLVVRLAPYLDDPAALALRVLESLASLGVAVEDARRVVTGAEPAFSALLLPSITRLAGSPGRSYVLVLDDIQVLARPQCHAILHALADGMPAGSQLALLGRQEPPAWLARDRAAGRLLELVPGDLAFDESEAVALVHDLLPGLPQPRVADLVARAEGWPVGLYLMVLARQSGAWRGLALGDMPVDGANRFIVDYLRAEVLAGYPEGIRDFLRRTSILDELDGPLCDAVLERRDSAAVLRHLAARLQLVAPVDASGHRFRYHHLLADALRADLEGEEPWLVDELRLRASQWWHARGDLDAAIRYAKAGGDLARTGTLVWAGVPACISSGRPDRLASWLGDLDDVQITADRWLSLAAAWLGLQSGEPDRMTRWLLVADEHAGRDWRAHLAEDEYAASLAAIHVTVGDGGLRDCIELCRGVQAGLPPTSGFRAAAFLNEGIALALTRDFQAGRASLEQAEQLARALAVPVIEANALAWQGLLAILADDWAQAVPKVVRVGELVAAHGLDRLATSANSVTVLALLQASRGSKQEARVTLGTARRLTSQARRIAPWFAVAGPLVQARVAVLLGEGALARTLCAEARGHMDADLADTLLLDFLTDTEAMLRTLQTEGVTAAAITAAELRVLQFLPSRLTFQQISEHLFLSQTTVKTHALSIYRKLGVASRDEAVARAQALGLLEAPPGA